MSAVGSRLIDITIDGADYTAEVSKAVIVSSKLAESDERYSLCGPKRGYDLQFTAAQDLAADSLWDVVWSRTEQQVPCLLRPYGNVVATEDQPHYAFTATVKEPDGDLLGGEANVSTSARQVIECVWPLDERPVKVTS